MNEVETILRQIDRAVASRDGDAFEDGMGALELVAVEQHPWSDEMFHAIKGLLTDDRVLECENSWLIVDCISRNWEDMSNAQHLELRPLWVRVFDRFADWMGAYVVADILGRRYAAESAFGVLSALSVSARLPHRALASFGLGRLARMVPDGPLHDRAVETLARLADSDIEDVKRESRKALAALKTPAERIDQLRRDADAGIPTAQAVLGTCHLDGVRVERDYDGALKLLELAAAQGVLTALSNLGRMYERGLGARKDLDRAIKLYKRAATGGEFSAQIALGRLYSRGEHVARDHGVALKWYAAAASQAGIVDAKDEVLEAREYIRAHQTDSRE